MKGDRTYIGTNGWRYRYRRTANGVIRETDRGTDEWFPAAVISLFDLDADRAALQEPTEEDAWVEIGSDGHSRWRISLDGYVVQKQLIPYHSWHSTPYPMVEKAYNKGREVALAERDEKAQALAEAVWSYIYWSSKGCRLTNVQVERLQALAREVQGEKPHPRSESCDPTNTSERGGP